MRAGSGLGVVLGLLVGLVAGPAAAGQAELLSIQGFPMSKNQFVDGFEIQTWGAPLIAVCHLPHPWRFTVGADGTPEGYYPARQGYSPQALSGNRSCSSLKGCSWSM